MWGPAVAAKRELDRSESGKTLLPSISGDVGLFLNYGLVAPNLFVLES